MSPAPTFSVVMAAYNRSRHIRPTIESVLRQSIDDFELIVVGDACTDDTEQAVKSFRDPRISWHNRTDNGGSQSLANNDGIERARGRFICYFGHDDIWAPHHLSRLAAALQSGTAPDFAVSGCIYHGPPDSGYYVATGLFESSDAALTHFFPPSSFGHRRDVTGRIGPWRDPREIAPPVDAEFLLRAANAGMQFVSTGQVTVHKFAAGHRYLSYLRQSSGEQNAMLELLGKGDAPVSSWLEAARHAGRGSGMAYPDYTGAEKGRAFRLNRQNKGLERPPLQRIQRFTRIPQDDGLRALDWYPLQIGQPFRWSGPNPRPRILIPYTGRRAHVVIQVHAIAEGRAEDLSIAVNDRPVEVTVDEKPNGASWLCFDAELKPDDYTVVTLHTPNVVCPHDRLNNGDKRRLGVAVANIYLDPF